MSQTDISVNDLQFMAEADTNNFDTDIPKHDAVDNKVSGQLEHTNISVNDLQSIAEADTNDFDTDTPNHDAVDNKASGQLEHVSIGMAELTTLSEKHSKDLVDETPKLDPVDSSRTRLSDFIDSHFPPKKNMIEIISRSPLFRCVSGQSTGSSANGDICRICHGGGKETMPLISPCKCSGTLRYVHSDCLKAWLSRNINDRCEICQFHFNIHDRGKKWECLTKLPRKDRPRLICFMLLRLMMLILSISAFIFIYCVSPKEIDINDPLQILLLFFYLFMPFSAEIGIVYLCVSSLYYKYKVLYRLWLVSNTDFNIGIASAVHTPIGKVLSSPIEETTV